MTSHFYTQRPPGGERLWDQPLPHQIPFSKEEKLNSLRVDRANQAAVCERMGRRLEEMDEEIGKLEKEVEGGQIGV